MIRQHDRNGRFRLGVFDETTRPIAVVVVEGSELELDRVGAFEAVVVGGDLAVGCQGEEKYE